MAATLSPDMQDQTFTNFSAVEICPHLDTMKAGSCIAPSSASAAPTQTVLKLVPPSSPPPPPSSPPKFPNPPPSPPASPPKVRLGTLAEILAWLTSTTGQWVTIGVGGAVVLTVVTWTARKCLLPKQQPHTAETWQAAASTSTHSTTATAPVGDGAGMVRPKPSRELPRFDGRLRV